MIQFNCFYWYFANVLTFSIFSFSNSTLNNVILSTNSGVIGATTGTTVTVNPSGQLTTLAGQQIQIATTGSGGLTGLPQTVMLTTQPSANQQPGQTAAVVAQKAVASIQQPQQIAHVVTAAAPGGITTVHKV